MIQAVSAVFIYRNEMFMVKRQNFLRAFPGYHAFPGGKVDANESDKEFTTEQLSKFPPVLMRALCRELWEELSYDLEEEIAKGHVTSVEQLGIATTPPFQKFRFKAYHYKIVLNHRPVIEADAQEASWGGWRKFSQIWESFQKGEIIMVVPTRKVIEQFNKDVNTRTIDPLNSIFNTDREVFHLEIIRGIDIHFVASNTIPPERFTNAVAIGDPDVLNILVDPSPKDSNELKKLVYSLQRRKPQKIILTHHHRDHHEFAPELARHFEIPIAMSSSTLERLLTFDADYFKGVPTEVLKEGEILTQWLGRDVRVFEIPGHDDGQIGLAPDTMEWFLVGDLVQEVGTVVINEPEGDMTQYMKSLQRVIDLNPNHIIPSHGMIMGGTEQLKKTLAHRQERENQILTLAKKGTKIKEILKILYKDIDPSLHPLATQNIKQHLTKLSQDGKLK